jgi:hypothetical protein
MDFDRLPTKPVVKSLASAQAEWDQWLAQNHIDFLRDGDGVDWKLVMNFDQLPSDLDRHQGKWVATLQLGIDLPVSKLVETGTLDAEADARLLALSGNGLVPLRMKKLQYEASSDHEMRDVLSRVLPELRENFRKTSLHNVKRDLLGRWIDGLSVFGEREARGVSRAGDLDDLVDF